MMERSANGSCTPLALSSGGSLMAMGVTRTAVIFMEGFLLRMGRLVDRRVSLGNVFLS